MMKMGGNEWTGWRCVVLSFHETWSSCRTMDGWMDEAFTDPWPRGQRALFWPKVTERDVNKYTKPNMTTGRACSPYVFRVARWTDAVLMAPGFGDPFPSLVIHPGCYRCSDVAAASSPSHCHTSHPPPHLMAAFSPVTGTSRSPEVEATAPRHV